MNIEKRKKVNYYTGYTLLFIICCLGVFYVYYSAGKSLIYNEDGWTQHYKALIYYSRYLKGIIKNIVVNHSIKIPQWDFSIGEGADIIGTFHYYVIGDPISFFSIFVPEKLIYIYFNFSVILRLYLSGIAFSELCYYKEKIKTLPMLIGSLIYVFCFWNIFNSSRHIYFLNPMIFFPMIVLGIEKIIDNKNSYLLCFSVLLSSLSNFYFFFNIVILTVIYVAVRLLVLYRTDISMMFKKLLIIFKQSLFGTMMSSIILLPIIYVFISDTRGGIAFEKHLFYPLSYYLKLPISFLTVINHDWLCLGYASVVLLTTICSVINRKKNINIIILNIVSLLFVVFPSLGQITNGNTYISNKWSFALALLFSYSFVEYYDDIKKHSKLLLISIILLTILFSVKGIMINVLIPLIICLVFLMLLIIENEKLAKIKNYLLITLVITNICFNANYHYSKIGADYASTATTLEYDKNIFSEGDAFTISKYIKENDKAFVRFSGNNLDYNSSVLFQQSSTSFFWSLSNPNITQYRKELDLYEYPLYVYKEFDKRFILYSISNVKYYITKEIENEIPYGFSFLTKIDNFNIYKNDNELPFGFTYENVVNYNDWNKLPSIDKELLLAKAIVLDNENSTINIKSNYNKTKCHIRSSEGLTYDDTKVYVLEENAKLIMSFEPNSNTITYVAFTALSYNDETPWLKRDSASKERSAVQVSLNNKTVDLNIYGNSDRMFNQRESFILNFGENNYQTNELSITFKEKGIYDLKDIYIYSYNPEEYETELKTLGSNSLKDVMFNTNNIKANITCDKTEYLFLSIPYSKGWKANVDGKKCELLRANCAYSAIKLEPGYHEIELTYSTPLLKEGLILSVIGIILTFIDKRRS